MTSGLKAVTAAALAGGILSFGINSAPATAAPINFLSVITFSGPGVIVFDDSEVTNSGTLNINDTGSLVFTGTSSFANEGFFNQTDSASVSYLGGATVSNSGTYNHDGGTATLEAGATFSNNAGFSQTAGTFQVDAGATFDGTGSVLIDGGTMTVNGQMIQTGVTVSGGTLDGTGTVQGSVNNTGGTVGPDIAIDGGFTQGPGGTLAIGIDSLLAFDVFDITGTATLDGTLDLTVAAGYLSTAEIGDSFTIVNWQGFSGSFATVTGLDLGDGKFFALDYGASGLTLTVATEVAAVPAPGILAIFGIGLAGLGFARRR